MTFDHDDIVNNGSTGIELLTIPVRVVRMRENAEDLVVITLAYEIEGGGRTISKEIKLHADHLPTGLVLGSEVELRVVMP